MGGTRGPGNLPAVESGGGFYRNDHPGYSNPCDSDVAITDETLEVLSTSSRQGSR
jgi:hypothetical protein